MIDLYFYYVEKDLPKAFGKVLFCYINIFIIGI